MSSLRDRKVKDAFIAGRSMYMKTCDIATITRVLAIFFVTCLRRASAAVYTHVEPVNHIIIFRAYGVLHNAQYSAVALKFGSFYIIIPIK